MSNPFEENFNEFWGVPEGQKEKSAFEQEDEPEVKKEEETKRKRNRSRQTPFVPTDDGGIFF